MFRKAVFTSILLILSALSLAACQKNEINLPDDPLTKAATCYAARITEVSGNDGSLSAEHANEAAQYIYLGLVSDGIAEQSKLGPIAEKGESLRADIEKAGNAAAYKGACEKAYPSTAAGSFKELPADDRSTRMQCFTLSTAALQTYQSSSIAPPQATITLNSKLDEQLRAEINAQGEPNIAELAGFAMRNMAKPVELGPMNEVLAACAKRYGG